MSADEILVPYKPRRTWLIGVHEIAGWKLKVYGIAADGREISKDVVSAALNFVTENVPWPNRKNWRFGFITIHAGTQAVWLLVDVWVEDIVRHFLFNSSLSAPAKFTPGPKDGTTACVWELEVIKHERDAWVRHVLSKPAKPDFEGYLEDVVEFTGLE